MPHSPKVFLLLLFFTAWLNAEVTPNEPFIHVEGEAIRKVPPDQFTLSLDILTRGETYDDALSANNGEFTKLLDFFESNHLPTTGIVSYEIQTEGKRANSWEKTKPQVYETNRDVKITLDQLDAFPLLVDYLNQRESTGRLYVYFGSTKEKTIEDELLNEAVANAKEKANLLTGKFGMQVKGVYTISEEHFMNIHLRYVPDESYSIQYAPASSDEGSVYYLPQTISFRSYIYVIFTIEKKTDDAKLAPKP